MTSERKHPEDEETLCGNTKIATKSYIRIDQLFKWSKPQMWSISDILAKMKDFPYVRTSIYERNEILTGQLSQRHKDERLFHQFVRFYHLKSWLNLQPNSPKDQIERIYRGGLYPHLWETDILALKVYTDQSTRCSKLRQTFFSDPSVTESDQREMRADELLWKSTLEMAFSHFFADSVVQNPKEKVWFARNRRDNQLVYHGSSNVCYDLFKDFLSPKSIQIDGPFSTTKKREVALVHFAADGYGILFCLKPKYKNNNQYSRGPIPVNHISAHPDEDEGVFYNGKFHVNWVFSVMLNEQITRKKAESCTDSINKFERSEDKIIMLSTPGIATKLKECFTLRYGSEYCWKLYDEDSHFMDMIDSALNGHDQSMNDDNIYGDNLVYDIGYNYDYEYGNKISELSLIFEIGLIGVILLCLLCFIGLIIIYCMLKKRIASYLYESNE